MIKEMLDEPVSKYTDHHLTVVESNLTISDAAKAMVDAHIDSILISEDNDIIGIITYKDILDDIVAKGKDPSKTLVKEIVHKPLIQIHKDSKVGEAIQLMTKHSIRRLVVNNDERPIGIISQKQLVGNMGDYAMPLPELEVPDKFSCPYCTSLFDNKITMSKHIDDIHIGKGLLEGNLAKGQE